MFLWKLSMDTPNTENLLLFLKMFLAAFVGEGIGEWAFCWMQSATTLQDTTYSYRTRQFW